jgi:GT2 family glycosyltransferase
MGMTARVGIVVLNWHGGAHTLACVESARAQEYPWKFVVLVDNASSGTERETLRSRYAGEPDVRLCFLDENRGYAGGNNAGIHAALACGADLVLVLTQDATLTAGALAVLVETAAADARIGVVGPRVIDAQRPERVWSVGERVSVALLCVPRTLLRHRRVRRPCSEVSGVLGCAMLLSRRCLETIGAFDEAFFAYYEEVDFCLRARRHGFRIVCAPDAVATHDGMRGFRAGFAPLSAELKARNLVRLMRRWAAPRDWVLLLPTWLVLLAGSAGLYALRGRWDIVRALGRGVRAGWSGAGGPLGAVPGVG